MLKITVTGLEQLNRKFDGIKAEIERMIAEAEAELAPVMAANIARETPVRTGFLRSSESAAAQPPAVQFVATAEYASFVEYGTFRQAANPFIERGVDASEAEAEAAFQHALDGVAEGFDG